METSVTEYSLVVVAAATAVACFYTGLLQPLHKE